MINGTAALDAIARLDPMHLELSRRSYASVSRPKKELWHGEGYYATGAQSIPVVGFPFLRKPQTHNSYPKIDQLGAMARALVAG